MPCYHPLPAWRGRRLSASGKRPVAFKLADGFVDRPLELPCGKCVGCIQDRASEWALRCEHEAKCHGPLSNWFLTLTYAPEHLPPGGSLVKADLQNFWKRLRLVAPVRYFACGEYGENLGRPHYHALAFGLELADMTGRRRLDGDQVFSSASLEAAWGLGSVRIDPFSPAAAQYVCNYVRKRVHQDSQSHYSGKLPEFQLMSRRPGIGSDFVSSFLSDIYPDGYVTRRGGSRRRAPRFYDIKLSQLAEAEQNPYGKYSRVLRRVKVRRAQAAASNPDAAGKRLLVREAVEQSRYKFYDQVKGRPFEKGNP